MRCLRSTSDADRRGRAVHGSWFRGTTSGSIPHGMRTPPTASKNRFFPGKRVAGPQLEGGAPMARTATSRQDCRRCPISSSPAEEDPSVRFLMTEPPCSRTPYRPTPAYTPRCMNRFGTSGFSARSVARRAGRRIPRISAIPGGTSSPKGIRAAGDFINPFTSAYLPLAFWPTLISTFGVTVSYLPEGDLAQAVPVAGALERRSIGRRRSRRGATAISMCRIPICRSLPQKATSCRRTASNTRWCVSPRSRWAFPLSSCRKWGPRSDMGDFIKVEVKENGPRARAESERSATRRDRRQDGRGAESPMGARLSTPPVSRRSSSPSATPSSNRPCCTSVPSGT